MRSRTVVTVLTLTSAVTAGVLLTSSPVFAGGVGDVLSPAFGTDCANRNVGSRAAGATVSGTGTASSNVLGLPLTSALNQCGGADMPIESTSFLKKLHGNLAGTHSTVKLSNLFNGDNALGTATQQFLAGT